MSKSTKMAIGILAISLSLLAPVAAHAQTAPTATSTVVAKPAISASPLAVVAGGTLTATWSNIPDPAPTDWIGLYQVGAPDMAYISWVYVSGSGVPSTSLASGSVSFTIPDTAAPGAYEVRLFANNGYARLAISNQVTVSEPTATSTAAATSAPAATNTPAPTSTPTTGPTATPTQTGSTTDDWRSIVIPTPEGDRKANHGWFVSWIAQFAKAFEDIKQGVIVSFFARSDLGKEEGKEKKARHGNGHDEAITATPIEESTAVPTSTAQPTATAVPATPTSTAEATAVPTATLEPTATPVPTVDPTVTPTATPGVDQETPQRSQEQEKEKEKEQKQEKELKQEQERRNEQIDKEKNQRSKERDEDREKKLNRLLIQEELLSGRSEHKDDDQKREKAGISQPPDPKPSPSRSNPGGRNR